MKYLSLSLMLLCAVSAQAAPWRMTYGTWGGFTGGGGGIEVRSDGSVFSTKALRPGDDVRTFQGTLKSKQLEHLLELAEAARSVQFRHPANMTTSLDFYADKHYTYAWEIGRNDLPEPLVEWTTALQQLKSEPAPGPCWDGEDNSSASANVHLGEGHPASITVELEGKRQEFQGKKEVAKVCDLAGETFGTLKVTKVDGWWIEGENAGKAFRLPVWGMEPG